MSADIIQFPVRSKSSPAQGNENQSLHDLVQVLQNGCTNTDTLMHDLLIAFGVNRGPYSNGKMRP
jgi:hypothetical protein